jgi:hypothetical protein
MGHVRQEPGLQLVGTTEMIGSLVKLGIERHDAPVGVFSSRLTRSSSSGAQFIGVASFLYPAAGPLRAARSACFADCRQGIELLRESIARRGSSLLMLRSCSASRRRQWSMNRRVPMMPRPMPCGTCNGP